MIREKIEIGYLYIHEMVQKGAIKLYYVNIYDHLCKCVD